MIMDRSAQLTVVLPIPNVKTEEELLEFLKGYGDCVPLEEAYRSGARKKTIVVGKIVREWSLFTDPKGDDKKVYCLESAAPGDQATFRFVASGRRLARLLDGVFSAGAGDYLALFQPKVMRNSADHPTVYFPHKKAIAWVCKVSIKKRLVCQI